MSTFLIQELVQLFLILFHQMLHINFLCTVSGESEVHLRDNPIRSVIIHLILVYEIFSFVPASKVQDCFTNCLACKYGHIIYCIVTYKCACNCRIFENTQHLVFKSKYMLLYIYTKKQFKKMTSFEHK